ncbi:MAG: cob(I)yrinic acid a,c-diamide adenosyltransferase [Candidatus Omnitrophica bacterium]|nr:cob(I)yrinic acid a,c-diamide adenosyltransferase [Candidatus Omnitrophota bacterium]
MIQVYTGNGKGKTTAALGLAIRAAGAGFNVYIAQFTKGRFCSEHKALKKIKNIKVEQFGRNCFIKYKPQAIDVALAHKGLEKVKKIISRRKYRLIILDEINVALKLRLVEIKDVLDLMKYTPRGIELVLTGRCAPEQIVKCADLVSQIKEIKHYYKRGFRARKGIEF